MAAPSLSDLRDDMHVIARALRRERHRQPMRQEVPVLGDEIDQDRTGVVATLRSKPLIFPREPALCRPEFVPSANTNCLADPNELTIVLSGIAASCMPSSMLDHQSVLFPAHADFPRRTAISRVRPPARRDRRILGRRPTAPGKCRAPPSSLRRRFGCSGRMPPSYRSASRNPSSLLVQCALVAFTAQRIFGKTATAFIASSIAALYPFFLFYQGLLLSETLFNTLLIGGIAALYWWRERGMRIDTALVVACLCFAAATLTKATLTILPPLLIAATAWTAGAQLAPGACCSAGSIMPLRRLHEPVVDPQCHAARTASFRSPPAARSIFISATIRNNPNAGIDLDEQCRAGRGREASPALPDEIARQRAYRQGGARLHQGQSDGVSARGRQEIRSLLEHRAQCSRVQIAASIPSSAR